MSLCLRIFFRCPYDLQVLSKYSGTPLIRSPLGQKSLAALTGDRINEGFLQENVRLFCRAAKKKWP